MRKNEIKHNKKNPLEEEITTNFYNFIYIETLFVGVVVVVVVIYALLIIKLIVKYINIIFSIYLIILLLLYVDLNCCLSYKYINKSVNICSI